MKKTASSRGRKSMFKKDEIVRNITNTEYNHQLGVVVAADRQVSSNPSTHSRTRYLVMCGNRSVKSHYASDLAHSVM